MLIGGLRQNDLAKQARFARKPFLHLASSKGSSTPVSFDVIGFNLAKNRLSHGLVMAHLYMLECCEVMGFTDFLDAMDFCNAKFHDQDVLKVDQNIGEAFLIEGKGYFLSSARGYGRPCLQIGQHYQMNAQEKLLFKSYPVRVIDLNN